jgi:hypothetical protein
MEQALSLPSATLRFAQLGWRVIRIEATPVGNGLPGDPNRYIGSRVADDDRRSYFIAPNVGKEAIALNLKDRKGQEVLPLARDRLRDAVGRQTRPDLGRNIRDGAGISGGTRLRSGDPGHVRIHGGDRRSEGHTDGYGTSGHRPEGGG